MKTMILILTVAFSTLTIAQTTVPVKLQQLAKFAGSWDVEGSTTTPVTIPGDELTFTGIQECQMVGNNLALQCQTSYLGSDGFVNDEAIQVHYDAATDKLIWNAVYTLSMFNSSRVCDFSDNGKTLNCNSTTVAGPVTTEQIYIWKFTSNFKKRTCIWKTIINGDLVSDLEGTGTLL